MNPRDLYQPFSPWWQQGNRSNRRRARTPFMFQAKRDAERSAKAERSRQRRKAAQARKRANKGNQG